MSVARGWMKMLISPSLSGESSRSELLFTYAQPISQGHCNGKAPLSGPYIFRKIYYCSVPLLWRAGK